MAASALFALAVVAAGCGQSSDETSATASSETETTAEATATSAEQSTTTQTDTAESTESTDAPATEANFPSVDVLDLATGEMINLNDTLSQGTTPVVFWFWAPH